LARFVISGSAVRVRVSAPIKETSLAEVFLIGNNKRLLEPRRKRFEYKRKRDVSIAVANGNERQ
jgi:hypothetical protein